MVKKGADTKPVQIQHRRPGRWGRRIIGIAIVVILFFLVWSWISSIFEEKVPKVPEDSVLVLAAYGPVVEYNRNVLSIPFLTQKNETLLDMIYSLKKAAVDNRIRGVVFKLGHFQVGAAQAKDLRDAILDYRKSNKKIYAYCEVYSTLHYYIASACDEVYLMPQGVVDMRGIAISRIFVKGTMDKLGIKAQFVRIREYKTAPTMFTEYKMTEHDIEQRNALLDTIFDEITDSVAEARGMTANAVKEIINIGSLRAEIAKEKKIIDDNLYLDEVIDKFKGEDEEYQKVIWHSEYKRVPAEEVGLNRGPVIAIVYATGNVVDGKDSSDAMGENMGSDTLTRQLNLARLNKNVKAVVFRIDSPGGSGMASEAILRGIQKLKESKKPVVASMGNVAASGGYYIACQADRIVAQPTTVTGSIGIFAGKFDLSGFYQMIGLNKQIIKRGKYADLYTETRPAKEEEMNFAYNIIQDFYRVFLKRVSEGRGKTAEEINEIGRGHVWSGKDARKIGLVDELGGINRSIEVAKELAGIEPEEEIRIKLYPDRKGFWDIIFSRKGKDTVKGSEISLLAELFPEELQELAGLIRLFKSAERFKVFALMPYKIEIK
jgi:protease-4